MFYLSFGRRPEESREGIFRSGAAIFPPRTSVCKRPIVLFLEWTVVRILTDAEASIVDTQSLFHLLFSPDEQRERALQLAGLFALCVDDQADEHNSLLVIARYETSC